MRQTKKLLSLLLVLCLIFTLTGTALAAGGAGPMDGKVVILHSNDVHGAIEGYALIAGLRDEYTAQGAEVILADAGDYSQGSTYVSLSKGANAITMMNTAGYDIATLGNHEFDYGYENLMTILADADFNVICGDVMKDGKSILDGTAIIEKGGVKIGFLGLETPETYTKVNPALIQGLSFPQKQELYTCAQGLVDELETAGADVIVGLFHLGVDPESEGNQSLDVVSHVEGIDFVIDAHSHTVMTAGPEGEPVQSTGTAFANVGVVVIDSATKKVVDNYLVKAEDITPNEAVLAKAKEIEAAVDEQFGAVFAKSEVALNGARDPGNRTEETNLGDLITDAMLWTVLKDGSVAVPDENVVGITNGGGIRASIGVGDITMQDVNTVLPFGNTVAVVYVTGAELLEALEASTYCTPTAVGGFPQIAGMNIEIAVYKEFDQGDQYPDSTYYGPKSIQRVTILDVNGKPFDEEATYAVVTNDFCSAGGDTYYAFKAASDQFDTSIPMDEALMNYISEELEGVVGSEYAEPQGRIKIALTPFKDIENHWAKDYITAMFLGGVMNGMEDDAFVPEGSVTRAMVVTVLYRLVGEPEVTGEMPFTDVTRDWYKDAVLWAFQNGITDGRTETEFAPDENVTRAELVTFLMRCAKAAELDVTGRDDLSKFTDKDQVPAWALEAMQWAVKEGIVDGMTETTIEPMGGATRAQLATVITRLLLLVPVEE